MLFRLLGSFKVKQLATVSTLQILILNKKDILKHTTKCFFIEVFIIINDAKTVPKEIKSNILYISSLQSDEKRNLNTN